MIRSNIIRYRSDFFRNHLIVNFNIIVRKTSHSTWFVRHSYMGLILIDMYRRPDIYQWCSLTFHQGLFWYVWSLKKSFWGYIHFLFRSNVILDCNYTMMFEKSYLTFITSCSYSIMESSLSLFIWSLWNSASSSRFITCEVKLTRSQE